MELKCFEVKEGDVCLYILCRADLTLLARQVVMEWKRARGS